MPEVQNTTYLSIGEVLGLLLEEFPDITISKIRFLESQGLIAPERTPSGYRKFYEPDVELLKVILREQRENYLPLRVIKDRIDSGAIDPSGEMTKPEDLADMHAREDAPTDDVPADAHAEHEFESDQGESNLRGESNHRDASNHGREPNHGAPDNEPEAEVPAATIAAHPASNRPFPTAPLAPDDAAVEPARAANGRPDRRPTTTSPQLLPGVLLEAAELCAMTSITAAELQELRSYGIVTGRESGGTMLYGDDAVEIAKVAAEFLRAGIDARHLRGWRTAAEREASIFEQLITPKLRQRNPESRTEALNQLRKLDALGSKLRTALMRTALRHHFEG
ncbi:MAG TPA: MerR family transcriptional regulator [Ilumatobacteraceae bacterium]|nr:MerR family transcriptional regulator [Ilumatobacteraceae bacterium]